MKRQDERQDESFFLVVDNAVSIVVAPRTREFRFSSNKLSVLAYCYRFIFTLSLIVFVMVIVLGIRLGGWAIRFSNNLKLIGTECFTIFMSYNLSWFMTFHIHFPLNIQCGLKCELWSRL